MILPISAGSISICATLAFFANVLGLPVKRSSKRQPIEIMKSASVMAILAAKEPCIPPIPKKSGWLVAIVPCPKRLVTTGI